MKPKRSSKAARTTTSELALVAEIASACRKAAPDAETFSFILGRLKKLVAFDAATVFLFDRDSKQLKETASLGHRVVALDFFNIDGGQGLTGWTAHSGKPTVLSDRTGRRDFNPDTDLASFLSVPLTVSDEVIGVINLGSNTPGAFGAEQADVMMTVANHIGLSLEKLAYQKKFEDLTRRTAKIIVCPDGAETITLPRQQILDLSKTIAVINHDINNSLSVLLGNLQCMLMEATTFEQKTLSRIKRMENATNKLRAINEKILELYNDIRSTAEDAGQDEPRDKEMAVRNV
ncbi:MAG: GAF domain-containing protein [Candidatus Zixiibacteriota bacterium]